MMLTSSASPARNLPCPPTKFTWGLDLSGQNGNAPPWRGGVSESPAGLHGAGGIGGLLGMVDTKGTSSEADDAYMIYFYDANGNVGQVMDARAGSAYYGQAVARYEYYPIGGVLTSAIINGSSGSKNPFLFSTKYRDSETGLYYYGERYLLPRLGRWLNRDPIEEDGNFNCYRFIGNDTTNAIEPLALVGYHAPIASVEDAYSALLNRGIVPMLFQGSGTTSCDPQTGQVNVTVSEHCAGNCVKQHEDQHKADIASCCSRYAKCRRRHSAAACDARWSSWVNSNRSWAECRAYWRERECLKSLIFWGCDVLKTVSCQCCATLRGEAAFAKTQRDAACAADRGRRRCPFDNDGNIRTNVIIGELPP